MIPAALRRGVAPVFASLVTIAFCAQTAPLSAAGASAWTGDARSALRLIAGTPAGGAVFLRAGIEIRLAAGWKTYWRNPGDSGVSPRFDFSRSTNLKSADVAWPAPIAWRDDAGVAIGYKEGVILPLRVIAKDPAQPVALALSFDYAICERICVPLSGRAELKLPAAEAEQDAALAAAEARVPRKTKVGDLADFAIRLVAREGDWPKPRIVAEVAAPAGVDVALFAEGPGADWALPAPEAAGEARDGARRFVFVLDGAPPGVDPKGATITLTAVAGAQAIEALYRLE